MKTIKLLFAATLLCSAVFVSCNKKNSVEKVEDDPIFNYQVSGDAQNYFLQTDSTSAGNYFNVYTIWKGNTFTFNSIYKLTLGGRDITAAKIDAWDAASGGAVSTPTNLAASSRVINSSTVSATSYSVAVKTHVDISCGADINIGVLGSGTGYVYLETLQSGSSTWIRRGVVTKVKGSLIGLNTGNGGTYGVNLNAGDSYRLISSSTLSGIGNTITYTMDGGSYYTY